MKNNLLIAKKVNGVFQKVAVVRNGLPVLEGRQGYVASSALKFFESEPAALDIEYLLNGIEYRVSKFF